MAAGSIWTYSASDTGRNYCMGMLTLNQSGDVMDPMHGKKCRRPVLVTDDETSTSMDLVIIIL